MLNLHSKQISLQSFFYFMLFICPPDVKRPRFFITPWNSTTAPPGACWGAFSTLEPSPAFYNIRKLNLRSKTDISKTAWINACSSVKHSTKTIYHHHKILHHVTRCRHMLGIPNDHMLKMFYTSFFYVEIKCHIYVSYKKTLAFTVYFTFFPTLNSKYQEV